MTTDVNYQVAYQVLHHALQTNPDYDVETEMLYGDKMLRDLEKLGYLPVYQELARLDRITKLIDNRTGAVPTISDPALLTEIKPPSMTESMREVIEQARHTAWAAYRRLVSLRDIGHYLWLKHMADRIRAGEDVDVDQIYNVYFKGTMDRCEYFHRSDCWRRELKADEVKIIQALGGYTLMMIGPSQIKYGDELEAFLRSRGRI